MEAILFVIGLMTGGMIGITIMCLCQVAHDAEQKSI